MKEHLIFPSLRQSFDELVQSFIDLYGLQYTKDTHPLARWLDFRCRYVVPQPRQIIYSNRFPKQLPPEALNGLKIFEQKIITGEDINPYQGKGLITNDTGTSGKRTDALWAMWGIWHFHLTDAPLKTEEFFSDRSDYNALCYVDEQSIRIIDVVKHPKGDGYSNTEWLHIIQENWPEILQNYHFPQLPGHTLSQSEAHSLRRKNINTTHVVNGQIYYEPGGGVMSDGTSMKLAKYKMQITDGLQAVACSIAAHNSPFQQTLKAERVHNPDFVCTVTEHGFVIGESHSKIGFIIDDLALKYPHIMDLLNCFPSWAVQKMLAENNLSRSPMDA